MQAVDSEKPALKSLERSDYALRTEEGLARLFDYFGRVEAPQLDAVLYQELCRGAARDPGGAGTPPRGQSGP